MDIMFNQLQGQSGISGQIGTSVSVGTPKIESAAEMLNTIINVAGCLVQSSHTVADAIGGSPEPEKADGNAPAPTALLDQLRMIRYMLNEAEGNLSRARQGLGA